jgi:hypothetical protein
MRYATTFLCLIFRGEIRHKLEVLKMKFSGNGLAQRGHFKYITRTLCNIELVATAYILSLRVVNVHSVGTVLLGQDYIINNI